MPSTNGARAGPLFLKSQCQTWRIPCRRENNAAMQAGDVCGPHIGTAKTDIRRIAGDGWNTFGGAVRRDAQDEIISWAGHANLAIRLNGKRVHQ